VPTRAHSSVWVVVDGLGELWEARGGALARFPWRGTGWVVVSI